MKVKNFLSIGEEPLEIDFEACPLTIIKGDNGNGKTTILEALTFALFGKTYRKINKSNIVNSYNGKDCLVELTLEVGQNEYKIVRGIKKDIFLIYVNGSDTPEDQYVGNEGQKRFENILGLDFNVYSRVIVLGTMNYQEYFTLDATSKRKFLDNIFGFDSIAIMDKDNKGIIKNLNLKLDQLDIKIDGVNRQKEQSIESVARMVRLREAKIEEEKELEKRIEVLDTEKKSYSQQIDELKNEISNLPVIEKPEVKPLEVLPLSASKKAQEMKEVVNGKREVLNDKKRSFNKEISDNNSEISSIKTKIAVINRDVHTFDLVLERYKDGGICPSCHQDLSKHKDEVENIEIIISEKKTEIEKLETDIEHINKLNEEIEEKINELNPIYQDLDGYDKRIDLKLKKAQDDLREKNNKIAEENSKAEMEYRDNTSLHRLLDSKLSNLNDNYSKTCKDYDDCVKSRDNIKSEINGIYTYNEEQTTSLKAELDDLNKEKESILVDINHHTIIGNLLKDSGVRKDIIDRYIPLFNKTVQKYLDLLGADYVFTVDANFKETIHSRGRESFRYESFSRGEQSRIDLAVLFSWRDIIEVISGQKMTSLFLDEVFDSSMDANGVQSIKRLLKSLEGTNIFTISHRSDQSFDMFDSTIEVNKVGRFSEYTRTFNN